MATAKIDVNYIAITEDRLREIIREELERTKAPGVYRPPYVPAVVPWGQAPVISSDTALAAATEGTMING